METKNITDYPVLADSYFGQLCWGVLVYLGADEVSIRDDNLIIHIKKEDWPEPTMKTNC